MIIKKTLLMMFCFAPAYLFSYWEWTPQTGRWVNPKYAVQETAEEQFYHAEMYREDKLYREAIREYNKVVSHFPASAFSHRALYELGNIYMIKGDSNRAFDYYQKILDDYPQSPLVFDVLEKQSELALAAIGRRPPRILSLRTDRRGEKLSQLAANYPYSQESQKIILTLANFYFNEGDYRRARLYFNDLIINYPPSEITAEAQYYLLRSEYLSIPPVSTDTKKLRDISGKADLFLSQNPDSSYYDDVNALMEKAILRKAEIYYSIASYYERAGKKRSARFYYRLIKNNYAETIYGKIASDKIITDN